MLIFLGLTWTWVHDRDKNSASSQIIWLLRDCQEKVNFEEPHAAPEATNDASQESTVKVVELQVKSQQKATLFCN